MRVAVIGLGEAGSLYATGFAAKGWTVTGFDPADNLTPVDVTRFDQVADAVAGADLVLSLTGGKAALRAATAAAPHVPSTALFADLNAGPATLKKQIAAVISEASGALFADVSVVGSVPTYGAQTPLVVSGPAPPGPPSCSTPSERRWRTSPASPVTPPAASCCAAPS